MEYSSPVPSSPALSVTMVSDAVALLATADFDMTTVTPADLASPTPDIKIEADDALENDESDKKPTKKRKSWGQVLPEPKTNLPPRLVVAIPCPSTCRTPHRTFSLTASQKTSKNRG